MKPLCCSKPVLLFSFLLFCLPSFAQLKADAGEDRVVCTYNYEKEYEIGGSPTASGGVGPYTYYWKGEGLVEPDNIWYLITNDLNDPANSNPKLIINNTWYSSFLFYLKVEDAAGNVAYDTVKIINANWRQLFYDSYDIVKRGDSIQLTGPFFDNDYLPLTYLITPSSGLTDSTNVYGWAKPDSSVTYYIQTENSYGCISPKVRYMNIKVVDSIMDSIYKAKIDSLKNLLIGEWEWCDSGGGLSGGGFGDPEENGYTAKIVIEQDLISDSLLFRDYVNDSLVNFGKANLRFWQNETSIFEINDLLPELHYFAIGGPDFPYGPQYRETMIIVDFFNKDSIRFYSRRIDDAYEVYYKRVEKTGVSLYDLSNYGVNFYPTPAKNLIKISNPLNIKIKKVELIDISGRIVQRWKIPELTGKELNLENVIPGIYLLKAETTTGVKTDKIVIQ